jgi:protein TonB
VISGPLMLQKRVLDSVRKYEYKPYLLNGEAVNVETTVWVTLDSNLDCHFD